MDIIDIMLGRQSGGISSPSGVVIDLDTYGVNPLVSTDYTGNQGEIVDIANEAIEKGKPVFLRTTATGSAAYVAVQANFGGMNIVASLFVMKYETTTSAMQLVVSFHKTDSGLRVDCVAA